MLSIALTVTLLAVTSQATGTCGQKTDGSAGGAVTDAECAAVTVGSIARIGATATTCAAAPCAMATAADFAACCVPPGTCGQKTDGTNGGAVTDAECAAQTAGYMAKSGAAAEVCATVGCDMSTAGDMAKCCVLRPGSCDKKTDGVAAAAVTDAECAAVTAGYIARTGVTTACATAPCAMATAADMTACCKAPGQDSALTTATLSGAALLVVAASMFQ